MGNLCSSCIKDPCDAPELRELRESLLPAELAGLELEGKAGGDDGLLPAADADAVPPEVMMLINKTGYEEDSDEHFRIMKLVFVDWLPGALLLAHENKAIKLLLRKLLGTRSCTANLEFYKVWDGMREKLATIMADLGDELRRIYEDTDLRAQLGSYEADVRSEDTDSMRQDCEDGAPLPPGLQQGGAMSESDERCYIHYLRLLAVAIDSAFLDAVNECVGGLIEGERTFHGGIKGFERMFNKMLSALDHRYDAKPRPAKNVDINRTLAVAENAAQMLALLDALQGRFGAFVKFKNGMALSDEDAASIFHLRLFMVSVLFEHPTLATFEEMCDDAGVQARWAAYAEAEAPATVPRGQWDRDVARALGWLRSAEMAGERVRMVCEVQCLLSLYRDVRMRMHEVYKAYRADTPQSLYEDFVKYGKEEAAKKKIADDGATPLLRAARDGDVEALVELWGGEGGGGGGWGA